MTTRDTTPLAGGLDRRSLLRDGGLLTLGALALGTVSSGTAEASMPGATRALFGNPAETPVPNAPLPTGLSRAERHHLEVFDELDFEVFSNRDWARLGESHAPNVRVHWPDGHYTDGIEPHIADLDALFVWAPDTRILEHPLRIAMNELTAVTGVMRGTFTQPMPDGRGGTIAPTGKAYAINMATVGVWNPRKRYLDEEFLFWDDRNFFAQIGLG